MNFLPSVLPISLEINKIFVGMLDVEFHSQMTPREVGYAIEEINSFSSEGMVFEGSMARSPWEQAWRLTVPSQELAPSCCAIASSSSNVSVPQGCLVRPRSPWFTLEY